MARPVSDVRKKVTRAIFALKIGEEFKPANEEEKAFGLKAAATRTILKDNPDVMFVNGRFVAVAKPI